MDDVEENSGAVRIPVGSLEITNGKELPTKEDVNIAITNSSSSGNLSKYLRAKAKYLRAKAEQIFNPRGRHLPMWKKIFLVSCLIAISMDPLFLYIPYLNEENKCIQMDRKLKIVALVFRCVTDISYLIYMIIHMRKGFDRRAIMASETTKKSRLIGKAERIFCMIPWSFILIDFLAILPLPQVIILVFFTKLRGSRHSSLRKFLNFLLLFQYVPRIIRIYILCRKLGRTPSSITGVLWVRGAFNLFLYIIASHQLGALWYFFSIEQEVACWKRACKNYAGCVATTNYGCNDKTSRNLTIINKLCPIDPPNAAVFDFGIYLEALQSGIHVSTDFPGKFLQCFWWGLRNLSSFGQNLNTSTNALETLFAALISIIGLLLFLYLIGNLQTYMQWATTKSEEIRQNLKTKEPEIDSWISINNIPEKKRGEIKQHILNTLEHDKDVDVEYVLLYHLLQEEFMNGNLSLAELQKVSTTISGDKRKQNEMKELSVDVWILRNGIPKDLKPIIMHNVRSGLQDNKEVDVESLLSLVSGAHRTILKKHLCLPMLNRVPILESMGKKVFEILISYLKPVVYSENSYIIRKGEPLDLMLFITQGVVWSFTANDENGSNYGFTSFKRLEKGDYYGEELLNRTLKLSESDLLSSFPISSLNVRTHTKVEAFILTANDLMAFKSTHDRLLGRACHTIQNVWHRHKAEKSQRRPLQH